MKILIISYLMLIVPTLNAQAWSDISLSQGNSLNCFSDASYDTVLDNYLIVNIGNYANAYIKIVDVRTNRDIRQVFIASNSSNRIKNIPEGKYYLKIAFGKMPQSNDSCGFRFSEIPFYKKGDNILDFNLIDKIDGYSVPSYELSLDVDVSFTSGTGFSQKVISVEEFNN